MTYADKVQERGIPYLLKKVREEAVELQAECGNLTIDMLKEWMDVVGLIEAVLVNAITDTTESEKLRHMLLTARAEWFQKNVIERGRLPLVETLDFVGRLTEDIAA